MFASYDAPPEVIRSYQRQWVRSVRKLGDKWLIAKQIERIEHMKSFRLALIILFVIIKTL
jgi:hypothetical protein